MANNIGKITQIIGAVLDIKFSEGNLPEINDAIRIDAGDGRVLVVEVSQHLGDDTVRCIAMGTYPMDLCAAWRQSLPEDQSAFR